MNKTKMIIKKELRDVFRDKKTLIMMILVPLLMYPIMVLGLMYYQDSLMGGGEESLTKVGFAFETDQVMNDVIDELDIEKVVSGEDELKEKLIDGEIDAYLSKDENTFTLHYDSSNMMAQPVVMVAGEFIEGYKRVLQNDCLTAEGLVPEEIFDIILVEEDNISNGDPMSEYIMSMIPSLIIVTATMTAIFAAIDITAGEKERGTFETLLTFPVKIKDIIAGKLISTSICTMISSCVGLASMYVVLIYASKNFETFSEMKLFNVGEIIAALACFVVYSCLVSSIAIVLASRATTFKEAQNATQPLSVISIIPMFLSMFGMKTTWITALIPIMNANLIVTDLISGRLNYTYVGLMIVSTIVFMIISINAIVKVFKSDKILFS